MFPLAPSHPMDRLSFVKCFIDVALYHAPSFSLIFTWFSVAQTRVWWKVCICAFTLHEQLLKTLTNFRLKHIRCLCKAITSWYAEVSFGPMCYILRWFTAFYYHTSAHRETFQKPYSQKNDNRVKKICLSYYPLDVLAFSPFMHVCCLAAQIPLLGCSRARSVVVTVMAELGTAAKHVSDKTSFMHLQQDKIVLTTHKRCELCMPAHPTKLQAFPYPWVLVLQEYKSSKTKTHHLAKSALKVTQANRGW